MKTNAMTCPECGTELVHTGNHEGKKVLRCNDCDLGFTEKFSLSDIDRRECDNLKRLYSWR